MDLAVGVTMTSRQLSYRCYFDLITSPHSNEHYMNSHNSYL